MRYNVISPGGATNADTGPNRQNYEGVPLAVPDLTVPLPARPKLLDLYCCAGGASMGWHRAGFDVYGVDLSPQPNYPFAFHRSGALEVLAALLTGGAVDFTHPDGRVEWLGWITDFDAIHASPPCQRHSAMSACRPGLAEAYPDLIAPTRAMLINTGLPYVIENVMGSPLIDPTILCGQMFGLELYRHRGFESNFPIDLPDHPAHVTPASKAGHWTPGTIMSVAGHVSPMWKAREVMGGIGWMNRDELGESIPPVYTEYIGEQLLAHLALEVAA